MRGVVGTIVMVTLLAMAVATASAIEDPHPGLIQAKALETANRIQSLEFASTAQSTSYDRGVKGLERSTFRSTLDYHGSTASFRCETKLIPDDARGITLDFISVYDGNRYKTFDKTHAAMGVSNSSELPEPAGTPNPFVIPYWFLRSDGVPLALSMIRNESLWLTKFKSAKFLRTVKDAKLGMTLDVIETAGWVPKGTMEISFSRELGYYPVRTVAKANGVEVMQISVNQTKVFDQEAGPTVAPLRVAMSSLDEDGKTPSFSTEIEVIPSSIVVNREIDATLFDIPVTIAETFTDIDTGVSTNVGGRLSTKELKRSSTNRTFWIVNALVTLTVAALIIRHVRKRGG